MLFTKQCMSRNMMYSISTVYWSNSATEVGIASEISLSIKHSPIHTFKSRALPWEGKMLKALTIPALYYEIPLSSKGTPVMLVTILCSYRRQVLTSTGLHPTLYVSLNGVCTWIPKCIIYGALAGSLHHVYSMCTWFVLHPYSHIM